MCLVLIAIHQHPDYPLIILGNRDEFYERPTLQADWQADSGILAGTDLRSGGHWLGIDREGRWATVTNVRAPRWMSSAERSRGILVRDFLLSCESPQRFLQGVLKTRGEYAGFNLVVADGDVCFHLHSVTGKIRPLPAGLHVVSNADLNSPWPKAERLRRGFGRVLASDPDPESFLALLTDSTLAEDRNLPDTGVGLDLERQLSSIFVKMQVYGTRASSLLMRKRDGRTIFVERSWDEKGHETGTRRFEFGGV